MRGGLRRGLGRLREPRANARFPNGITVRLHVAALRPRDLRPDLSIFDLRTRAILERCRERQGPVQSTGPSTFVSDDQVVGRTFAACGPF
jgi:hypothetical protein